MKVTDRDLMSAFLEGETMQSIASRLELPRQTVESRIRDREQILAHKPRVHLRLRGSRWCPCGRSAKTVLPTTVGDDVSCRKCLAWMQKHDWSADEEVE